MSHTPKLNKKAIIYYDNMADEVKLNQHQDNGDEPIVDNDQERIKKKIKKKMRKIRRQQKKAKKTLSEIPKKIDDHQQKLKELKQAKTKESNLHSLITQLDHDIEKCKKDNPTMYQIILPRVVLQYAPFPEGVTRIILDFMNMNRLNAPNTTFVRINLERFLSPLTPIESLMREYALAERQLVKDQKRIIKMREKTNAFCSDRRRAAQEVESARKGLYSTQKAQDNATRFLLQEHMTKTVVPIVMAYLGNRTRYSSSQSLRGRPRYGGRGYW